VIRVLLNNGERDYPNATKWNVDRDTDTLTLLGSTDTDDDTAAGNVEIALFARGEWIGVERSPKAQQ
jgi:hypothetical protein